MRRKGWLAFAMLATGAGLLAAAQLAAASQARYGGILRYGTTGASVQIDPQIAYITTAWWLEDATAAKLYTSSPQGTLVPQVASGYKVSNGGRTYAFTIRRGFRFSDGTHVTARNFVYAINRVANKTLASPGAQFITDPSGAEIVGAARVNDGDAHYVRGVAAQGNKLVIHLVRPDPSFLAKLTMPFFQATSTKLPLTQEALGAYPSAGRYAFTHNEINVLTSIRRNPYWRRGPGRLAPRHLDGLDLYWNQNEQTLLADVRAGRLDEDSVLSVDQRQALADEYGVNKSRFWLEADGCTSFLAFNNANRLFKGNVRLRRAVNYAIDRTDYTLGGRLVALPWSRLLPPSVVGLHARQPYPAHADLAKARKLARGHFRGGKITVYYRSSGKIGPAQAQVVRNALIALGFKPEKITMKGFSGGNIYTAMGVRGNDADIGISMGWCSDYPSGSGPPGPEELLGLVLDRPSWWAAPLGIHDQGYSRRFVAAQRLHGKARLRAFAKLDFDLMRNAAPVVVAMLPLDPFFFSDRVDPASLRYETAAGNWDIGALALK